MSYIQTLKIVSFYLEMKVFEQTTQQKLFLIKIYATILLDLVEEHQ